MISGFPIGSIVTDTVEGMLAAVRCSGLAFTCNASTGIFGGSAPGIAARLPDVMHACWITGTVVINVLTALFVIRETEFLAIKSAMEPRLFLASIRERIVIVYDL
ncbi:MAG: hypothetical protein ACK443_09205 [Methylococcaceae bacterium]|jgi:hypothetical protein